MNGPQRNFFVSYTAEDESWAEWIGHVLEDAGYTTIVEAWDFRPGSNFVVEMHRSLESVDRIIAVLSPDYLRAAYPRSEWASAFRSDPDGLERRLVPVVVQDCEPEGLLGQIVKIRIHGLDDATAKRALLDGLQPDRTKPNEPPKFPGSSTGAAEGAQQGASARPKESGQQARRTPMLMPLGIIILVALCCGLLRFIPDQKSSLPEENGTRPTGSSDAAIIKAAVEALDRCAKAVVLQPVNCPQEVDEWNGGAENVKWLLHGDPGQGAVVRYNGAEGRFHVLGTTVMTASYQTSQGPELKLRVVQYWARVEWNAGKAIVAEIKKYDDSPRPPILKSNPGVAGSELLYLVGKGFEKCASSKQSPLPPECLPGLTSTSSEKASWKLHGDPTINAAATFDKSTGLIHVVGNYSMRMSYNVFLLGPTSEPHSGQYDAIISVDASKPRLLMITPKN